MEQRDGAGMITYLVACHMSYTGLNVLLQAVALPGERGRCFSTAARGTKEANRRLEKMPQRVELQQRLAWIRLVNG